MSYCILVQVPPDIEGASVFLVQSDHIPAEFKCCQKSIVP
jgi:hypothetical protein